MKDFRTLDEQISILKNRNLRFLDEEAAKRNLIRYGYYEIVNGYKEFLLDKNNQSKEDYFIDGAKFEHLFAIYELDKQLKNAVLQSTLDFELTLKTALAYSISEHYGYIESDYLNRKNYNLGNYDKKYCKYELDKLFDKFTLILKSDVEPYKHYREFHKHIPPWILLKGCNMGNVKYFYNLQKSTIKTQVTSILLGVPENYITQINDTKNFIGNLINLVYKFRNQAAHNGRIYNYKTSKQFSFSYSELFHQSEMFNITKYEFDKGYGKNDLYTLLMALSLLNNLHPYISLSAWLILTIDKHLKLYPEDKAFLLDSIGVPPSIVDVEDLNFIFSTYNKIK